MNLEQRYLVVNTLAYIRKQTSFHLSIGHSYIPYDILMTVVHSSISNNDLTVKALFASLPYSVMGLRYHFRQLIEKGWIELESNSNDARIKHVRPTSKLNNKIDQIVEALHPLISDNLHQKSF